MRFHPSGVSPLKETRHLLGVRFALVTFFPNPPDGHGTRRCWAPPSHASRIRGGALLRLQGLCPPVSPCATKTAFTALRASFPSWAFPSLRCSPHQEIERISPLVLSRASTNPSLKSCPLSLWPVGTSEFPSPGAVALSLSRPPDRFEVSRRRLTRLLRTSRDPGL